MRLLTLLLVPGLHEHHLFVFVPRSVGSVGSGDAPRPRGGWLDTSACPTAPATVLHNGGGTLLRPFAAALGSPQTLTTWSRSSFDAAHTTALYISFLFFLSPSSPLSWFLALSAIFAFASFSTIPTQYIGSVSLRERDYSSVGGRNTGDPDWGASKQRPNNCDVTYPFALFRRRCRLRHLPVFYPTTRSSSSGEAP